MVRALSGSLRLRTWLAASYDKVYSDRHRASLERWVVGISVVGFVLHLALIFLSRALRFPPPFIAAAGKNYLAAIYTPFSIILFYEVLILISAIPESTTKSIATQFEIVSLIFIRGFFKDIAEVQMDKLQRPSAELLPLFLDVCAGLLMFLLVTVFQHVAAKSRHPMGASVEPSAELSKFISRKKAVALALTTLLLVLAARSFGAFIVEDYRVIYHGAAATLNLKTVYYTDVFAVMIFTDVLILILSLTVSNRYELVFRNAAFVISTILIRFSLTSERPYGAVVGLAGMVFGIVTLAIYNYHTRVTR